MKVCTKCAVSRPLDDYYRHPMANDGHSGKCIECTKADARANRAARLEYYRAYDRSRNRDPDRVAARADYQRTNSRRYPETNPQKKNARTTLGNTIRDGNAIRPPLCEICGISCEPHGHHDDYSKPLDVIWCCSPCHALIHAYWRAQERSAA